LRGDNRSHYHLAVGDALRHHLCRPDPCIELLDKGLGLKLDKILVRLVRPDLGLAAVAPQVRGLGHLDQLGQLGRLRLARGLLLEVALTLTAPSMSSSSLEVVLTLSAPLTLSSPLGVACPWRRPQ
jgi:hypothetical protein